MRQFVITTMLAASVATGGFAQDVLDPVAGNEELAKLAREARDAKRGLTFEEFRDQTVYLPETGKYYVNGDTPIRNEKLLREFWTQNIAAPEPDPAAPGDEELVTEFAVMNVGGLDQIWSVAQRHALTYCVSTAFGSRHATVVANLTAAAAALETVGDLNYHYVASEDGNCDQHNTAVLFDVRPINTGGQFLAAAFFPNDPREKRSLVIDPSSFELDPNGALTLTGILRHELGHTIGGRHEHTRPEAGTCFEDNDWRGVTSYDAFSFMHYPQCRGKGDWTLRLTALDKNAIACLYGPAPGFLIDPTVCSRVNDAGPVPHTAHFGPFTLARNENTQPFEVSVTPGTPFTAQMTGTGDPDLYLKLNGAVAMASYDCRPYVDGPDEICNFDVPDGVTQVRMMVRGYTAATAEVTVNYAGP